MEMDEKVNAHFHLYATGQKAQRINLAFEILEQVSSDITERKTDSSAARSYFYWILLIHSLFVILELNNAVVSDLIWDFKNAYIKHVTSWPSDSKEEVETHRRKYPHDTDTSVLQRWDMNTQVLAAMDKNSRTYKNSAVRIQHH